MKRIVQTEKAPAAIGPYSQGIKAGEYWFFSGQIPLDPATGEMVQGGIEAEVTQVLANMTAMLDAAGLTTAHVVKTTIFLTNLDDFTRVNRLYGELFPADPPARAVVQVAALPKGAQIEMEWVAWEPAGSFGEGQ